MIIHKKYIVSEGPKPQKAILFTDKRIWSAFLFLKIFIFFLFLCALGSIVYYFMFGNPLIYPSNEPLYMICLFIICIIATLIFKLRTVVVSIKLDSKYLYTTKKQKILVSTIDSVDIKTFDLGYAAYVRCGDKIIYLMSPTKDKNLAQVVQEKLKIWIRGI